MSVLKKCSVKWRTNVYNRCNCLKMDYIKLFCLRDATIALRLCIIYELISKNDPYHKLETYSTFYYRYQDGVGEWGLVSNNAFNLEGSGIIGFKRCKYVPECVFNNLDSIMRLKPLSKEYYRHLRLTVLEGCLVPFYLSEYDEFWKSLFSNNDIYAPLELPKEAKIFIDSTGGQLL